MDLRGLHQALHPCWVGKRINYLQRTQWKNLSNWIKENQGYLFEITVPKTSIAQVVINKKPHEKITILEAKSFVTTDKADLNVWKFNLKGREYALEFHPNPFF